MGVAEILQQIDHEIAHLQQARALLNGGASQDIEGIRNRRSQEDGKKKRKLTPEGRKRIAEAVKRRGRSKEKLRPGSKSIFAKGLEATSGLSML